MIFFHFLVVIIAILVGIRLGNFGFASSAALGVLILGLTGCSVNFKQAPMEVVSIIILVICATSAMQLAGGLDILLYYSEKLLRKNPDKIMYLSPLIGFILTFFSGSANTFISTYPIIVEISKQKKIQPRYPLCVGIATSCVTISCAPISAAVITMLNILNDAKHPHTYKHFFIVLFPAIFLGSILTAFIINKTKKPLDDKYVIQPINSINNNKKKHFSKEAKASLFFFLGAIVFIVIFSMLVSGEKPILHHDFDRTSILLLSMGVASFLMIIISKVKPSDICSTKMMSAGIVSAIATLFIALLGISFLEKYNTTIDATMKGILGKAPWLLAIGLALCSAILSSQGATVKALMPLVLAMGISPATAICCFPAIGGVSLAPTQGPFIAASEFDDTGSTKLGKYFFDHSLFLPAFLQIVFSVGFAFIIGQFLL